MGRTQIQKEWAVEVGKCRQESSGFVIWNSTNYGGLNYPVGEKTPQDENGWKYSISSEQLA